jgi:hypothetical protein
MKQAFNFVDFFIIVKISNSKFKMEFEFGFWSIKISNSNDLFLINILMSIIMYFGTKKGGNNECWAKIDVMI